MRNSCLLSLPFFDESVSLANTRVQNVPMGHSRASPEPGVSEERSAAEPQRHGARETPAASQSTLEKHL